MYRQREKEREEEEKRWKSNTGFGDQLIRVWSIHSAATSWQCSESIEAKDRRERCLASVSANNIHKFQPSNFRVEQTTGRQSEIEKFPHVGGKYQACRVTLDSEKSTSRFAPFISLLDSPAYAFSSIHTIQPSIFLLLPVIHFGPFNRPNCEKNGGRSFVILWRLSKVSDFKTFNFLRTKFTSFWCFWYRNDIFQAILWSNITIFRFLSKFRSSISILSINQILKKNGIVISSNYGVKTNMSWRFLEYIFGF